MELAGTFLQDFYSLCEFGSTLIFKTSGERTEYIYKERLFIPFGRTDMVLFGYCSESNLEKGSGLVRIHLL